ncbi:MAG: peptide ABC transporter substrate-binding protein [Pyrinomonadaceae bacterium]
MASVLLAFFSGSCLSSREADTYYGTAVPPSTQELRWSDGGLPRSFDPAQAAAAPETDVVRALFEGLTDYDPQTLSTLPAAAISWESSADHREWTFRLRRDAHWTNGDAVTSGDFVRSWQRALKQGEKTPHADLLRSIEGASESLPQPITSSRRNQDLTLEARQGRGSSFGVQSIDDYTLRVRLARSNPHFPDLVAHPVFRPVHQANSDGDFNDQSTGRIISNGAFKLLEATPEQVTLDRSRNYWDASRVALDRVKFVQTVDNERALNLYRAGEINAVSNANLEPLAVKLLTPYQDFRRRTFGALVYYSFNMRHPALADRRVREALAIAINRQRLCADIMDGVTEPAEDFLPDWPGKATGKEIPPTQLRYDPARAKRLMSEAGYDNGHNFPRIRLLVNRNDQQRGRWPSQSPRCGKRRLVLRLR